MKFLPRWTLFAVLFSALFLCGFKNRYDFYKPAPTVASPIVISVDTEKHLNVLGVYRVPDSQLEISGSDKGGFVSSFFGPIGFFAGGAMQKADEKKSVQAVTSALHVDLNARVLKIVQALIGSGEFGNAFVSEATSGGSRLELGGSVVATYINDTDAKLFVVLYATIPGSDPDDPIWGTRYVVSMPAKPMVGEDSWTNYDGKELKDAVDRGLRESIQFMLRDIASPYPRDENKLIAVEGYFPYFRNRFRTVGFKMYEDEQSIVVLPKVGDWLPISGVNFMDKQTTTFHPATGHDPTYKLVR